MKYKALFLLGLSLFTSANIMAKDINYTKGIGVYPGDPAENKAPVLEKDFVYRNVALNRAAYASSSFDYNLTAQLVTDGIISSGEPATITVSTDKGVLDLRDQAKTFDGNVHSSNVLMGDHSFIQYDWTGMKVDVTSLHILGEVAFDPQISKSGYQIQVMASNDGNHWREIGKLEGTDLPGEATQQMVSSDPNKQEAVEKLPLRELNMELPIDSAGEFRHLRLNFLMPGCAYWRIYEIGSMQNGHFVNESWMPSYHFNSVWISKKLTGLTDQAQWLKVDLGTEVNFDKVRLYWLHRPLSGRIEVSKDGRNWTNVADLHQGNSLTDSLSCNGYGRYVRLLMEKPDESQCYGLKEIQIMGEGGLSVAEKSPMSLTVNALRLNQSDFQLDRDWILRRDKNSQWVHATVPGTVLTSYMNIGAVPDDRYDNNMRQISESFFNSDFWYRNTFKIANLKQSTGDTRYYLNFDGINWKAVVFLNGNRLGNIDGAFIRGRFDVTKYLKNGENKLEVKVIHNAHFGPVKVKNEESTDLNGGILGADNPTFHASIGWDWITSTPGRDVGIWNDVYLSADKGIHLHDPVITTTLDHPDTLATMTPRVLVKNELNTSRTIMLKGWIGPVSFEKKVDILPLEDKEVSFSPDEFSQLKNRRMHLWWPNGYGEPYLYRAGYVISVIDGKRPDPIRNDSLTYQGGIREVAYKNMNTVLTMYVNGKRFVPLGGNWGFSEINLNYRGREYDTAVRYHKEMNYNMIRDWVGQIGDDEFYQACDKYGIMVWQDFWLANPWDGPDPYNDQMFLANAKDYILKIRNHPSIGLYVGRNEGDPPASLNEPLQEDVKALHPQLGYIPNSADHGVWGHGPYGVKPASFYFSHLNDKLHSEKGMPNVMNYESLCRTLKPDHLWPQNIAWGQHDYTLRGAQNGQSFNEILLKHFGPAKSAKQFTEQAQWLNYDGHRAMYESAEENRMGLLIWMSHPCWPTMVWQTYDYFFEPTAAYFGIKKACESLHVQFNPVKKVVEVVNLSKGNQNHLIVKAQILNMYGKQLFEKSIPVTIMEDETKEVLPLDLPDEDVYYIRLTLSDQKRPISENFYVEGKVEDDWKALNTLPAVRIKSNEKFRKVGDEYQGIVTVSNPNPTPAMMIRLNLVGADGVQILPVIYSDNYFHLMPGERKTVHVSYRIADGRGTTPYVRISGFNLLGNTVR
ncbi:MAG: discoidin domain-containing protein [Prevotella sp.]|jgi:hypothetical protein|nr:discoidin domain-containing protein [Prevotella sp.]